MEYYGSFHRANSSGYIPLGFGTMSPLPPGQVGVAYSAAVIPVGGQSPYTVSLVSSTGSNPWSVSASGVVTGTPTLAEADTLTIRVVDSVGAVATQPFVVAVSNTTAKNYLGVNLNEINYYNSEQPFINLLNGASSNGVGGNPVWFTAASSTFDTNEEAYLAVDANGYPTSLVATNGGVGNGNGTGGAQQFTYVQTYMNVSLNAQDGTGYANGVPPGAASLYPTGAYTFQFQGAFTGSINGNASGLATTTAGVTVVGNVITSALAPGVTGTVTFNVSTATTGGLSLNITAIPNSSNYPQALVIAQTSLLASYNAGSVFHPNFLSSISNIGYSCIRFKDWLGTDFQVTGVGFSGALSAGATAATLAYCSASGSKVALTFAAALTSGSSNVALSTAWKYPSGTIAVVTSASQLITMTVTQGSTATSGWSAVVGTTATATASTNLWGRPSGTYTMVIGNQASETADTVQLVPCAMTYQSAAVVFNVALTSAVTWLFQYGVVAPAAYAPTYAGWTNRSTLSQMSYAGPKGAPYELCLNLSKALGVDTWLVIPVWANQYQGFSSFWTSLATLCQTYINNGFKNKIYIEFSNEVWNGVYITGTMLGVIGYTQFGAYENFSYSQQEYMGTQVAGICDAFKAVLGSTTFASQIVVTMGSQTAVGNGSAFLAASMNTPHWTSAAYTHGVGGYHFGPYMGSGFSAAGDYTTLLATANPLNALFSLAYSNTDLYGNTYTSLSASGFIGGAVAGMTSIRAALASQPWHSLPMLGYETGEGFDHTHSNVTGWIQLFEQATRDVRMSYCYYDPTNQLSANAGYLPMIMATGFDFINQYSSCVSMSVYGVWGALENTMQVTSPISSAPPKVQGIANWIAS